LAPREAPSCDPSSPCLAYGDSHQNSLKGIFPLCALLFLYSSALESVPLYSPDSLFPAFPRHFVSATRPLFRVYLIELFPNLRFKLIFCFWSLFSYGTFFMDHVDPPARLLSLNLLFVRCPFKDRCFTPFAVRPIIRRSLPPCFIFLYPSVLPLFSLLPIERGPL